MTTQSTDRLHALDAVRGGALLLGIAVHLSMSFWPIPLWPIRDSALSGELFSAFLVQHIFRMTVFFVMAGFFARLLFQKRGPLGFIKDRATRIGVPLLVGWPILFAGFVAVIIWSAVRSSGGEMPQPPQGQPGLTLQTVPLLHTWFLYLLLWIYAGALALVGLFTLIDRKGRIGAAFDSLVRFAVKTHTAPLFLGAPLAAFFLFKETWVQWAGVHTPDMGLLPNLSACIAYATAFGFGWMLHRQSDLLSVWKRWWPLYLVAAISLTVPVLSYAQLGANPAAIAEKSLIEQIAIAGVYPLAMWTWSFALIGMALAFLSKENKVIRYVADSSYWLYLIHLPVVMIPQVLFSTVDLPWFVKFPTMLALSFAFMLVTYQLLVRNTPIGHLLNGRRYGKRKPKDTVVPPAAQPSLT